MRVRGLSQIRKANGALLERGETASIPEYFSPDYVVHVTGRTLTGGRDLIRRIVTMYQRAFADITVELEILSQEGDRVSWQRTIRGTQRGPFKGFPASGRRIVWREMITSRFEGNLIAEEWFLTDLAERLLLSRKQARP